MIDLKKAGLAISVIILIAATFIPATETLSTPGIRTIGITLSFLIVLITEALPLSVICWITVGLLPIIGAADSFAKGLSGFANPVLFFILSSFGLAHAYTQSPLSKRILVILLKSFGKNIKSMLLALMICIAIISSVVSSVPTCALFMSIGLSFLELFDDPEEKKRTGRAIMIAIPVTSIIGGMITPAGSSINLLAIQMLEETTGQTITFVQWMAVGSVLTLLILPIAWLLIVKVYRPAEIKQGMVEKFVGGLDVPEKVSLVEKKILALTAIMLTLWILSSWIREINVMVISLLGCCAFFMPGVRVLEWNSFIKNVNLDSYFLVGTVLCIGKLMVDNGVSGWLVTLFPTAQMSLPVLIAFTATLIFIMLIIIPVAPSLVTFLAAPLISLATGMGYSAPLIILVMGMCAANCYLLPLDTVPLITYSTGYYSMLDMPKSTLPLQACIVVIVTAVITFMSQVLHII